MPSYTDRLTPMEDKGVVALTAQEEIDYLVSRSRIYDFMSKLSDEQLSAPIDSLYVLVSIRIGKELTEIDKKVIGEYLKGKGVTD